MSKEVIDSFRGMISAFAMSTAPTGWLACDGTLYERDEYPELFGLIGTTFGEGDGVKSFAVPDLRGKFARAWSGLAEIDAGREFGSDQPGQNASHFHTASSAEAGSHKHTGTTGDAGAHTHAGSTTAQGGHRHGCNVGPIGLPNFQTRDFGGGHSAFQTRYSQEAGEHAHGLLLRDAPDHGHEIFIEKTGEHSHEIAVDESGGLEARPTNIALLFCVRY